VGCRSPLQTRPMTVLRNAQTSAATLNHSALNVADALGPWLAGIPSPMGFRFATAGRVGAAVSVSDLVVWLYTWRSATRRAMKI
jgi:MFS transporter, DHA1 family, inner membrane transport protein